MALESRGRLTATAIDLVHHADMVQAYNVTTVPFFFIGERAAFPGPLPELLLLQRIADYAGDR